MKTDTVSNKRDFAYMSFFSAMSKDDRFHLYAGHIKKICVWQDGIGGECEIILIILII